MPTRCLNIHGCDPPDQNWCLWLASVASLWATINIWSRYHSCSRERNYRPWQSHTLTCLSMTVPEQGKTDKKSFETPIWDRRLNFKKKHQHKLQASFHNQELLWQRDLLGLKDLDDFLHCLGQTPQMLAYGHKPISKPNSSCVSFLWTLARKAKKLQDGWWIRWDPWIQDEQPGHGAVAPHPLHLKFWFHHHWYALCCPGPSVTRDRPLRLIHSVLRPGETENWIEALQQTPEG